MKKFLLIFIVGIIAVVGGCDLQPKIASIPDDVGDFISTRYPTLLAEPDSDIYKTAVADYGVYASATEYGNGDVTENDYVLYSPADDYMMPAQDTDVPESDVGMPEVEEETEEVKDESYAPDTDVDDLKIPDYVGGKPKVEPEVKAEPKAQQSVEKQEKTDDEKTPETMRAPLREITIGKGDTLYSVSRKYSVPVNDLAVLNKISAPFALSVGQKIKVPDVLSVPEYKTSQRAATVKTETKTVVSEKTATPKVAEPKAESTKSADVKKENIKKVEKPEVKTKPTGAKDAKTGTTVKQADTKKTEAKSTVKKESKTAKATQKKPDEKTLAAKKVATKAKTADTKKSAQTPKTKTETKKETKAAKADAKKTAADTKKTTQQKRAAKQLAARSSSKFSWPLRGKILSGFGSKPNGLVNDGINIKGNKGANVLAAENGFVAYAGNEVKGMGNLIIVQHSDGFMTVYAHMDTMNVRRGNTVAVGQKIGTVGQSGKVDQPQLHFEIRKGTRAYNPINYLKK